MTIWEKIKNGFSSLAKTMQKKSKVGFVVFGLTSIALLLLAIFCLANAPYLLPIITGFGLTMTTVGIPALIFGILAAGISLGSAFVGVGSNFCPPEKEVEEAVQNARQHEDGSEATGSELSTLVERVDSLGNGVATLTSNQTDIKNWLQTLAQQNGVDRKSRRSLDSGQQGRAAVLSNLLTPNTIIGSRLRSKQTRDRRLNSDTQTSRELENMSLLKNQHR